MNDKEKTRDLEEALTATRQRLRGVPFALIVKSLSDRQVIRMDKSDHADIKLLEKLEKTIQLCADEIKTNPIRRPRPNEVGNDVEAYVMRALARVGLHAVRPTSLTGLGKSTGYPDILVRDDDNRATYLECKTFKEGAPETTMRSFYLSPSESFKVSMDARHLLLAFGMERRRINNSDDSLYLAKSYKLVDLHDLLCDVKYEFNSDNRRLYAVSMILSQGHI